MATREANLEERFKIWYLDIFHHLEKTKDIPGGNGAIVALAAAMPLYERWLDEESKKHTPQKKRAVLLMADLGLKTEEEAGKFWNVFRDGLCHSGSFYTSSSTASGKGWILPKVGLSADHPDKPHFAKTPDGKTEAIFVNPWGLIRHILIKYEGNPMLIRLVDTPLLPLLIETA